MSKHKQAWRGRITPAFLVVLGLAACGSSPMYTSPLPTSSPIDVGEISVAVPLVREQSAVTTKLDLTALLNPQAVFNFIQASVQNGATIGTSQSVNAQLNVGTLAPSPSTASASSDAGSGGTSGGTDAGVVAPAPATTPTPVAASNLPVAASFHDILYETADDILGAHALQNLYNTALVPDHYRLFTIPVTASFTPGRITRTNYTAQVTLGLCPDGTEPEKPRIIAVAPAGFSRFMVEDLNRQRMLALGLALQASSGAVTGGGSVSALLQQYNDLVANMRRPELQVTITQPSEVKIRYLGYNAEASQAGDDKLGNVTLVPSTFNLELLVMADPEVLRRNVCDHELTPPTTNVTPRYSPADETSMSLHAVTAAESRQARVSSKYVGYKVSTAFVPVHALKGQTESENNANAVQPDLFQRAALLLNADQSVAVTSAKRLPAGFIAVTGSGFQTADPSTTVDVPLLGAVDTPDPSASLLPLAAGLVDHGAALGKRAPALGQRRGERKWRHASGALRKASSTIRAYEEAYHQFADLCFSSQCGDYDKQVVQPEAALKSWSAQIDTALDGLVDASSITDGFDPSLSPVLTSAAVVQTTIDTYTKRTLEALAKQEIPPPPDLNREYVKDICKKNPIPADPPAKGEKHPPVSTKKSSVCEAAQYLEIVHSALTDVLPKRVRGKLVDPRDLTQARQEIGDKLVSDHIINLLSAEVYARTVFQACASFDEIRSTQVGFLRRIKSAKGESLDEMVNKACEAAAGLRPLVPSLQASGNICFDVFTKSGDRIAASGPPTFGPNQALLSFPEWDTRVNGDLVLVTVVVDRSAHAPSARLYSGCLDLAPLDVKTLPLNKTDPDPTKPTLALGPVDAFLRADRVELVVTYTSNVDAKAGLKFYVNGADVKPDRIDQETDGDTPKGGTAWLHVSTTSTDKVTARHFDVRVEAPKEKLKVVQRVEASP